MDFVELRCSYGIFWLVGPGFFESFPSIVYRSILGGILEIYWVSDEAFRGIELLNIMELRCRYEMIRKRHKNPPRKSRKASTHITAHILEIEIMNENEKWMRSRFPNLERIIFWRFFVKIGLFGDHIKFFISTYLWGGFSLSVWYWSCWLLEKFLLFYYICLL